MIGRNELTTAGEDDKKTKKLNLGKCTHQCDETQGNNSTRALSTKLSSSGARRKTTKEEGEEREEGADVKKMS